MGELDNMVAVITGAARGQGRSHAVALAEQGADIIAVDICADIDAIPYPLGTKSDLDETARLVEAAGRRAVPVVADVRDLTQLEAGIQAGIDELGEVDIVIANAGVVAIGDTETRSEPVFNSIVDTNLKGVWHTLLATVPSIIRKGRGGSIVMRSLSTAVMPCSAALSSVAMLIAMPFARPVAGAIWTTVALAAAPPTICRWIAAAAGSARNARRFIDTTSARRARAGRKPGGRRCRTP